MKTKPQENVNLFLKLYSETVGSARQDPKADYKTRRLELRNAEQLCT